MYTQPHQMEPMLPQFQLEPLHDRAQGIVRQSLALSGRLPPATLATLRALVRSMNSYYSNRIEGQSTHPLDIERALRHDFSDKPDVAKRQRLALAHIDAEMELEGLPESSHLTAANAQRAHLALYGRLSVADRTTEDNLVVEPGVLRTAAVDVGRHVPPDPAALPAFLARYDQVYGRPAAWDEQLIAVACAHHRLAWIHPFLDGNGRTSRLQTHCALWPLSGGLWSPSRGLARQQAEYYARLADADAERQGALGGRGNLTEKGLRAWCDFFLQVCEDQVDFMTGMLDLEGMKTRIDALITFRAAHDKAIRRAAVLPLYYLFATGTATRGEFAQMTGLGERVARTLISRLLATGLLVSDSAFGPVRLGLPLDALQFLLPELYPEAATKAE